MNVICTRGLGVVVWARFIFIERLTHICDLFFSIHLNLRVNTHHIAINAIYNILFYYAHRTLPTSTNA